MYIRDELKRLSNNPQDTNLAGANLAGANLEDADLQRANLKGANFKDANLNNVNISDVNLEGAKNLNLKGTIYKGIVINKNLDWKTLHLSMVIVQINRRTYEMLHKKNIFNLICGYLVN
jgi:uncharacterized protein YjbI with pentapeptide repeats